MQRNLLETEIERLTAENAKLKAELAARPLTASLFKSVTQYSQKLLQQLTESHLKELFLDKSKADEIAALQKERHNKIMFCFENEDGHIVIKEVITLIQAENEKRFAEICRLPKDAQYKTIPFLINEKIGAEINTILNTQLKKSAQATVNSQ